jgi:hypothetical protein
MSATYASSAPTQVSIELPISTPFDQSMPIKSSNLIYPEFKNTSNTRPHIQNQFAVIPTHILFVLLPVPEDLHEEVRTPSIPVRLQIGTDSEKPAVEPHSLGAVHVVAGNELEGRRAQEGDLLAKIAKGEDRRTHECLIAYEPVKVISKLGLDDCASCGGELRLFDCNVHD